MNPCADDSAFDWIREGRDQLLSAKTPNWRGNFVPHLMPSSFEAYAKILHGIEANYENVDSRLTDREIELLKIPPCERLRSFIEKLWEEHAGSRITWKTLGQLFGVPFDPEICHEWFRTVMDDPACWPRFLRGPDEGNLGSEELSAVCSLLQPYAAGRSCYIRFAEIPFYGEAKPVLFRARFDELEAGLAKLDYQLSPEYWWPPDRSWCLCTDYDLCFTVVGGPQDLISGLIKDRRLEALEVTSQTRIDSFAPLPRVERQAEDSRLRAQ